LLSPVPTVDEKPVVIVVGPLPPPLHGHMVVTQRILSADRLARDFELVHVDQSDHRALSTLNQIDVRNVWLAFMHAVRLASAIVRRRPAIVYLPLAQNRLAVIRDMLLLSVALLGRSRVIAHVHGGGFAEFVESEPAWFSRPLRALLGRCAAIVAMSEWQRDRLVRALPGISVSLVRHGTAPAPAVERAPRERLRVLFLSSNLIATKGLFVVLEAAEIAEREGLAVDWQLAGTWSIERDRARARPLLEARSTVTFSGPLAPAEVEEAYAGADVFVFPTTPIEGFGLVRIEAMAAGLPVITTEAGGAREIVRDGVDGFIVDHDTPQQIVDRLRLLLADPELRLQMGREARRRQQELFSEDAFADALAATWSEALA
jgi:glycosyltransferase involved in cell wall biosynthesis